MGGEGFGFFGEVRVIVEGRSIAPPLQLKEYETTLGTTHT
jgi:hypothetical protein